MRSVAGQCFGPVIVPPVHVGAFSHLENKLIGYADYCCAIPRRQSCSSRVPDP